MRGRGMERPCGRLIGTMAIGCALWLWADASLAQVDEEEHPDVRVVVDVSGSMKENDPDRLALSALDMLVALLPNGATAGVWTFGATVDNPLPLDEVDAAWRERALGLSPALQEYQQNTDIEMALREAAKAEANGWRHLVLLTDGMVDLPPARGAKPEVDDASRVRLVDELAAELADQGVAIHAIAFSDQADLALVERLAQSTGGLAALAENPESLLGAFLDIIERIFPADQVPLEEGRFVIDDEVETFSALVFHEPEDGPLTLIAPDGTRYRAEDAPDAIRWQMEPRFDLIRVPDPQVGEWRLEGRVGEGSRVNVASPLHLRTADMPATLYLGFEVPVEAWMERDGDPLGEGEEALTLSVSLQDSEGAVQSRVTLQAESGRFRGRLPAPALTGNAHLVIRAEGESFYRQRVQAVNVLPAIGAVYRPRDGRVVLVAEHPRLNRDNTEIHAELQGERLEARAVGSSRWHLDLPEHDEALSRPMLLSAIIELDGETRELALPRLMLNPEGRVGIDLADVAGPILATERFENGSQSDGSQPSTETLADRFVTWVNRLPEKARDLWQAGMPGLQRLWEAHRGDPRLWGVVAAVAMAVLLWRVVSLSRRRRAQRPMHREEPHV
ncbi:vWA domain-containing protein [Halomonas daqiaonensis]|uniref:TIGR03503 family protein n=1 Tax=Halomonas daqiaonensis TaxID=650850 RepID=A0A1H7KTA3_9GAMM|nr:vWA domain-containing protein [Halomonas daqiaonensis]SEK89998.1 TIGR03503 family protein [Halomonas daqiaonensis]